MTEQAPPTALLAALERAQSNLRSPPFEPLAAAVEEVCAFLAAAPGAEPPRTVLALISLHPPPSEARLQANLAALEFAKHWLDEAYTLIRMPGSMKPEAAAVVLLKVDTITRHVDIECERHRASIERRRVAAELAKLAQDTARWLSVLPSGACSSRLERASEFLVMGYVALAPGAADRSEITGEVSATERRLLETLESTLTRLLAVDLDGITFYESLVLRCPTRPTIDDAIMRQVLDGLAWLLRAVQEMLRPYAPPPGTAPTQPAPEEPQVEKPAPTTDATADADALRALEAARDHAYLALVLNMDAAVFRPVLAGAIEEARGEIARAQRMIAPIGATDTTPRELDAAHATTPEWALTNAHAVLLLWLARPVAHTPARNAVLLAARALRDACAEAYRTRAQEPGEAPAPEELTHNQRVTLFRGLHTLTEAHAYACDARRFGEDDQSPDGSALEQVCTEVWAARELVRRRLEAERQHLPDGWDNEHVLRRGTTSATRALVVLHETVTEWLDVAAPRRRSFPCEVPDDVLQAVRGALLSADRAIVARTAYPAATTARRFLGGVLKRLARWVRP